MADHTDDGLCWCNPIVMVECPMCVGLGPDRKSCKRCGDSGLVAGEWDEEVECAVFHLEFEFEGEEAN